MLWKQDPERHSWVQRTYLKRSPCWMKAPLGQRRSAWIPLAPSPERDLPDRLPVALTDQPEALAMGALRSPCRLRHWRFHRLPRELRGWSRAGPPDTPWHVEPPRRP